MEELSPRVRRNRRGLGIAGTVVALGAGAALLVLAPDDEPETPPGPLTVAAAWPRAQRADLPGNLADGPIFRPLLFLDARVAVGTAPSPDAGSLRLVLRDAAGGVRELRRLPAAGTPEFGAVTAADDDLAWTETAAGGRVQVWAARLGDRAPARRLVADAGDPVFYGSRNDLVLAEGRVHWAAAPPGADGPEDDRVTEIRSVPLAGGPVRVRTEPGTWALSTWPWLVDGAGDQTGTRTLRNLASGRDTEVSTSGTELVTCEPVWCRALVFGDGGLVRIDVLRPDGSDRRRVAGGTATAAITDVTVLDRFVVLAEAGPDAGLTGTEGLLVHDLAKGRTVAVDAAVTAADSRGGVLWWSTGDQDATTWHSVDLRTA